MHIASAKFNVPSTINPTNPLLVKAVCADSIGIDPTTATYDSTANEISISNVAANTAFGSSVKYYRNFWIVWYISDDGGVSWVDSGTSENEIFICLSGPGPTPYRTVVYLACSNDGASNSSQAATNTWALFAGPKNVKAWNEATKNYDRKLFYYKPGTSLGAENPTTTAGLLNVGSGQCIAWSSILQDAWSLNGVASNFIEADPIGSGTGGNLYTQFNIRHWKFNTSTSPISGTWKFIGAPFYVPGDVYGDLKNENGLPGQNDNTPSQKVFDNHQFLKYGSVYYDPSYGVTYADEMDFQVKALSGFGFYSSIYHNYFVEKNSTTLHVEFTSH